MKILIITPSLDVKKYGGIARYSLEILNRLNKKHFVEVLEVLRDKNYLLAPLRALKKTNVKYDIIHSITPEISFLLFLSKKFQKTKKIITFHDFIPILFPTDINTRWKELGKDYFYLTWRLSAYFSDYIIVNSSLTKTFAEIFAKGKKIFTIHEGVDKKFKIKRKNKLQSPIKIGFIGRYSQRKRVEEVIKVGLALKKYIDIEVLIASNLPDNMKRSLEKNKIFKLLGRISEEEIVDFYNSLDFLLFSSLYEGFGLPILESQKCGTPVITYSDSLIPREVQEKTIKVKNAAEATKKILFFVENKKEYYKIRKEGYKFAKKFTWESTVEKLEKVYLSSNTLIN